MPEQTPPPDQANDQGPEGAEDFGAFQDPDKTDDELAHTQMSFLDHLDELRVRLVRIGWGLLVCFIATYAFKEQIYRFLTEPLLLSAPEGVELIYLDPTEAFFTYIKVAFLASVVLASPWIFYQIWRFISPGLYKKERRLVWPFVISSSVLFIGGSMFCFMVVFPYAFQFLRSFETAQAAQDAAVVEQAAPGGAPSFRAFVGAEVADQLAKAGGAAAVAKLPPMQQAPLVRQIEDNVLERALGLLAAGGVKKPAAASGGLEIKAQFTMRNYLSFTSTLLLAFGFIFETPLVLVFLGRLGIVSSKALRKQRKYAILIMFIVGALFTPPDVVTQCLMAVPLIVLYEVSIWLVAATERKKAQRRAEEEAELEAD